MSKNMTPVSIFRFKKLEIFCQKKSKKINFKFFFAHKIHIFAPNSKSNWLWASFRVYNNATMEWTQFSRSAILPTGCLRGGGSVKDLIKSCCLYFLSMHYINDRFKASLLVRRINHVQKPPNSMYLNSKYGNFQRFLESIWRFFRSKYTN